MGMVYVGVRHTSLKQKLDQVMSLTRRAIILACLGFIAAAIVTPAAARRVLHANLIAADSACLQNSSPADKRLTGDWDYYVMLGGRRAEGSSDVHDGAARQGH
jgi:hypothetical protein